MDAIAPGNYVADNKLKCVSENECFIHLRGAFWLSALASSHNLFTYSCKQVSGAAAEPVPICDDQIHHNKLHLQLQIAQQFTQFTACAQLS